MSTAIDSGNGCVTARQFVQCTACTHPQREALDAAVIRGDSDRTVAAVFGLSHDAVCRHRERHLRKELRHALAIRGRSWTQRVDKLGRVLERQVDRYTDINPDVVQKTANTLNGTLRMLGDAAGMFPKVDIHVLLTKEIGAPVERAKSAVGMLDRVERMDDDAAIAECERFLSEQYAKRGLPIPQWPVR